RGARPRVARTLGERTRTASASWPRDELAQQRYHPRRPLRSRRRAEGAADGTDQGRVRRCARAGDRRRRDDLSDVASFVNLFVFLMFLLPIGVQPDMVPPGFGFMIYLNRFTT